MNIPLSVSLSGKKCISVLNLKGKAYSLQPNVPLEISKYKMELLNLFMFPLFSKNWDILQQNLFFIEKYKSKLEDWYKLYKLEDLLFYINFLKSFDVIIQEHNQLKELEQKVYGISNDTNSKKSKQIYSMIYKTTMIKLKPEYEVYDSIFGKPQRRENETYKEHVILRIQKLLTEENMNFTKLKNILLS